MLLQLYIKCYVGESGLTPLLKQKNPRIFQKCKNGAMYKAAPPSAMSNITQRIASANGTVIDAANHPVLAPFFANIGTVYWEMASSVDLGPQHRYDYTLNLLVSQLKDHTYTCPVLALDRAGNNTDSDFRMRRQLKSKPHARRRRKRTRPPRSFHGNDEDLRIRRRRRRQSEETVVASLNHVWDFAFTYAPIFFAEARANGNHQLSSVDEAAYALQATASCRWHIQQLGLDTFSKGRGGLDQNMADYHLQNAHVPSCATLLAAKESTIPLVEMLVRLMEIPNVAA
jgi:hypothetical protein